MIKYLCKKALTRAWDFSSPLHRGCKFPLSFFTYSRSFFPPVIAIVFRVITSLELLDPRQREPSIIPFQRLVRDMQSFVQAESRLLYTINTHGEILRSVFSVSASIYLPSDVTLTCVFRVSFGNGRRYPED